MGMTPPEVQSLEEVLHRYFSDVQGRLAAVIYETNEPLSGFRFPDAVVATKVFIAPRLGDEAKQLADQMLAEVRGILGDERWPLVQARLEKTGLSTSLGRMLDGNGSWKLRVWVETNDKGTLTMGANWSGAVSHQQLGALSMFLPEGDPNRTEGSEDFDQVYWPAALRQRGLNWLQEQAIARLGKGANR
jgi:hypothetical protein